MISEINDCLFEEILQDSIKPIILDVDTFTNSIDTNTKIFNLLHMNIRSIKQNFDDLLSLLESYECNYCDIVILSECWKVHCPENFNIPGYTSHYNFADINKNDGLFVFVKSSIISSFSDLKFELSGISMCRISFEHNNVFYAVNALYRPPSTNVGLFLRDINQYFLETRHTQIEIFVGDININLNENSDVTAEYVALLGQHGFVSCINDATRCEGNSNSCIDHIFLKRKLKLDKMKFQSYVIHASLTDHFPIMLNISNTSDSKLTEIGKKGERIVSFVDRERLDGLLTSEGWERVLSCEDPNRATTDFVDSFLNYVGLSTETKSHVCCYKKIKPWITEGIITAIKHRDKLKRNLIKKFRQEQEQVYRDYRNMLKKLINKTKNDYYRDQINKNGKNTKKIYQIIKSATNETSGGRDSKIEIVKENGDPLSNDRDMADYCNEFFIGIGEQMAREIKKTNIPMNMKFNNIKSLYLKPVTENEVLKYISSLKNSASPGEDGIGSELIKNIHLHILKPLAHIINLIFRTGIVPEYFKTSIVVPIYKSGDKNQITNYRPISLINNFSKILEKALKERLINFLNSCNILSDKQYAFLENMSTNDAMCQLVTEITNQLNEGRKAMAVFLDLAKAFDTVPHHILLEILSRYGVRGPVLSVFESYLKDRHQRVRVNGIVSDAQTITMGIPQGTVLGPILFLIYINPLLKEIDIRGSLLAYADDTVMVFSGDTWEGVKCLAESGLERVKNWFDYYRLSLNLNKTKFISFSQTEKNRPTFNSLEVGDSLILGTDTIKYLGITIDCHLKWKDHVARIVHGLKRLIHKFYILREILNEKLLISVYKALVESVIRYGILVWGGMYKASLQCLNVLQNYILKIIFKKPKLFHTALLYSENILNVRCLYILTVSRFMIKSTNKSHISHSLSTRNKQAGNLSIPKNKTTLNLKSIIYLGPKIYNALPHNLRCLKANKIFNRKCSDYIFSNYDNVYAQYF